MSKNIIVTGGSGMAGKWVVKDLLAHGHQVLNLDRVPLKDSTAGRAGFSCSFRP